MSIFKGNNITPADLRMEIDMLERSITSLETLILESERHRMGLTSDEDYKMWLRARDQDIWKNIFKRNELNKEELNNG